MEVARRETKGQILFGGRTLEKLASTSTPGLQVRTYIHYVCWMCFLSKKIVTKVASEVWVDISIYGTFVSFMFCLLFSSLDIALVLGSQTWNAVQRMVPLLKHPLLLVASCFSSSSSSNNLNNCPHNFNSQTRTHRYSSQEWCNPPEPINKGPWPLFPPRI